MVPGIIIVNIKILKNNLLNLNLILAKAKAAKAEKNKDTRVGTTETNKVFKRPVIIKGTPLLLT